MQTHSIPVWSWRDAIRQSPVSLGAKCACYSIANYLSDAGRGAFPSVKTLMGDMNCSNGSLSSYLREAVTAGLLVIQRRHDERGWRCGTLYVPQFPNNATLAKTATYVLSEDFSSRRKVAVGAHGKASVKSGETAEGSGENVAKGAPKKRLSVNFTRQEEVSILRKKKKKDIGVSRLRETPDVAPTETPVQEATFSAFCESANFGSEEDLSFQPPEFGSEGLGAVLSAAALQNENEKKQPKTTPTGTPVLEICKERALEQEKTPEEPLPLFPEITPQKQMASKTASEGPRKAESPLVGTVTAQTKKKGSTGESTHKKRRVCRAGDHNQDELFNRMWEQFPRGQRKKSAYKHWAKLPVSVREELPEAAKRYLAEKRKENKTTAAFRQHTREPANWVRDGDYELYLPSVNEGACASGAVDDTSHMSDAEYVVYIEQKTEAMAAAQDAAKRAEAERMEAERKRRVAESCVGERRGRFIQWLAKVYNNVADAWSQSVVEYFHTRDYWKIDALIPLDVKNAALALIGRPALAA